MNCGEKIAELRKKRGMTQDDLGKAMNVSYQAVSKWERDESQPDFETMTKIAKLFNVPLGYFAEDSETEEKSDKETIKEEVKEEVKKELREELTREVTEGIKKEQAEDPTVGNCTVCGKLLKESEIASYTPKLVCKSCAERKEQETLNAQKKAEEDRKLDKQLSAREILGHGFDVPLIISLVLAFVCYVALTAVTILNQSSDDGMLYGFLTFLCPLAVFACTHAVVDAVSEWRNRDSDEAYTRNLSLIVGACFAAVNLAIFLSLYFTSDEGADLFCLILLFMSIIISFTI